MLVHLPYQNLVRLLGEDWLNTYQNHFYHKWITKPEDNKEKILLGRLDFYLEKVVPLLLNKKILVYKLRNFQRSQFIDTFYELEVGCSLMDAGFVVDFEGELTIDGNTITLDIVITNENVIVEIKTLHESREVKKGRKSNICFKYDEIRRVKNPLCKEQ